MKLGMEPKGPRCEKKRFQERSMRKLVSIWSWITILDYKFCYWLCLKVVSSNVPKEARSGTRNRSSEAGHQRSLTAINVGRCAERRAQRRPWMTSSTPTADMFGVETSTVADLTSNVQEAPCAQLDARCHHPLSARRLAG